MGWPEIKLILYDWYLYNKKYWKSVLLPILFGLFLKLIELFIRGAFVERVSEITNYTEIIFIGTLLGYSFWQSFGGIARVAVRLKRAVIEIIYKGSLYAILRRLAWDFEAIFLKMFGYIVFSIITGVLSISQLIILIFFSMIISFSSYATGLLLSPLFLKARSEAQNLLDLIEDFLSIVIPSYFMLSHFFFYKYVIFVPPAILIEEFRKFVLGMPVNASFLAGSLAISLIYFLVGYFLFRKYLNIAKKEGWISLK